MDDNFKMKYAISTLVIISAVFFMGLTPDEVRLYGSRIIICGKNDAVIKYWTPHMYGSVSRNNREDMIFDLTTKKNYKFSECRLYMCSPEPWRMYDCKLPFGNPQIKK